MSNIVSCRIAGSVDALMPLSIHLHKTMHASICTRSQIIGAQLLSVLCDEYLLYQHFVAIRVGHWAP